MLKLGKLSIGHEGNASVSFSSDGNENNGECHVSFCWSDFDTFVHSHPEDGRQNYTESDEKAKDKMLGDTQNKVTNFGVYLTKSRTVISF